MNPIDQLLANALSDRDLGILTPAKDHFPQEFIADLKTLFEKQSEDPNRWFALARGLMESSLFSAATTAFDKSRMLLPFAVERAKVFVEWAQLEEAAGRQQSATAHYNIAHRLDRDSGLAAEKCKEFLRPAPHLMLGQWDIFGMLNDPIEFNRVAPAALFPTLASDICRSDLARRWFLGDVAAKVATGEVDDCSFVVTRAAKPILRVECDIHGDRAISCHAVPVVFSAAHDVDEDDLPPAYELALQYLVDTAQHVGSTALNLEEPDVPVLTPISIFTAERPSIKNYVRRSFIDLTQDEAAIWRGVRKGHRHAINWGKKSLELRFWKGGDDALYADFVRLHDQSGRQKGFNGPKEIQPFWTGDAGELSIAYHDDNAVGAVAVSYEGEHAYYMCSVSVDHREIAPTHWPLYHAILQARERGIKTFQFGYQEIDPKANEKKRAIAHFKDGFTKSYENYIWWHTNRNSNAD